MTPPSENLRRTIYNMGAAARVLREQIARELVPALQEATLGFHKIAKAVQEAQAKENANPQGS